MLNQRRILLQQWLQATTEELQVDMCPSQKAAECFGNAIEHLAPIRKIQESSDTMIQQNTKLREEIEAQNNEFSKKFGEITYFLESIRSDNEALKVQNKQLVDKVDSMEESQAEIVAAEVERRVEQMRKETKDEIEQDFGSKLDENISKFQKLFEEIGESFLVTDKSMKAESERIGDMLEGMKKNLDEAQEASAAERERSQAQQRKEWKSAVKDMEEELREVTMKMTDFKAKTRNKIQGMMKWLDKQSKSENEGSSDD
jgi:chromosome segregation ATPase